MFQSLIKRLMYLFKIIPHMIIWKKQNRHNFTHAVNIFSRKNVSVGKGTYGPIEVLYDSGISRIQIGNYCS